MGAVTEQAEQALQWGVAKVLTLSRQALAARASGDLRTARAQIRLVKDVVRAIIDLRDWLAPDDLFPDESEDLVRWCWREVKRLPQVRDTHSRQDFALEEAALARAWHKHVQEQMPPAADDDEEAVLCRLAELAELSAREVEALQLVYLQKLGPSEAAALMGVELRSIRVYLARARDKLSAYFSSIGRHG